MPRPLAFELLTLACFLVPCASDAQRATHDDTSAAALTVRVCDSDPSHAIHIVVSRLLQGQVRHATGGAPPCPSPRDVPSGAPPTLARSRSEGETDARRGSFREASSSR